MSSKTTGTAANLLRKNMQNLKDKEKRSKENVDKKKKNLCSALVTDQRSIFYATDKITNNLINKARVSSYRKDKAFINIYKGLGNKKTICK